MNSKINRFFYKINSEGNPVPGSNIKKASKPVNGKWKELEKHCCTNTIIPCNCKYRYFIKIDFKGEFVDYSLIKRIKVPESDSERFVEIPGKNICCPILPPTASAGPDQSLISGTTSTTLTSFASTSGSDIVTSILWTKVSGPGTQIITTPTTTSTTVTGLIAGVFVFNVLITNNNNLTSNDTVTITVA